jgi:hypothetical protein
MYSLRRGEILCNSFLKEWKKYISRCIGLAETESKAKVSSPDINNDESPSSKRSRVETARHFSGPECFSYATERYEENLGIVGLHIDKFLDLCRLKNHISLKNFLSWTIGQIVNTSKLEPNDKFLKKYSEYVADAVNESIMECVESAYILSQIEDEKLHILSPSSYKSAVNRVGCRGQRALQANTALECCIQTLLAISKSGCGKNEVNSSHLYGSRCAVTFDDEAKKINELLGFVIL